MNVSNTILNKSSVSAVLPNTFVSRLFKKAFTLWILRTINLRILVDQLKLQISPSKKALLLNALLISLAGVALLNTEYTNTSLFALSASVFITLYLLYTMGVKKYQYMKIVDAINSRVTHSDLEKDLRMLGMSLLQSRSLREKSYRELEVVLAEWDQNNNVRHYVDGLLSLEELQILSDKFKPRERNKLKLVICGGNLAIKKVYETIPCMMNEVFALNQLSANSYVPKLLKIQPSDKTVYMTYIPGKNLGNLLKQHGVTVSMQHRDAVNKTSSDISHVTLVKLLSTSQIEVLKILLKQVHRAGVAIRDIKYGNIILQGEEVYLCDFDAAYTGNVKSFRLYKERCYDTLRFNELFASDLPTGEDLASFNNDISPECYAPIYIGKGVGYGKVGSIEFGTGKWQLIKHHLPDLKGKRIVDMGSNNGNLPLEMLRAGAKHVLGFELNPSVFKLAKRNHQIYEFVDNVRYSFDLRNNYMHGVLEADIAGYDMATSFCSLYYENVENMEKITNYLSRNVKIFVVQANENRDEHVGDMLERSSVEFLQKILRENGFKQQEVIRFPHYDRPMIISYSDYNN